MLFSVFSVASLCTKEVTNLNPHKGYSSLPAPLDYRDKAIGLEQLFFPSVAVGCWLLVMVARRWPFPARAAPLDVGYNGLKAKASG